MTLYEVVKSLYNLGFSKNIAKSNSELRIIQKSIFISDLIASTDDEEYYIHTGFTFTLQNNKLMELIYCLNNGAIIRQTRKEGLCLPQILGSFCSLSDGHFNNYNNNYILTAWDINKSDLIIDTIESSENLLQVAIKDAITNKLHSKKSVIYSLSRGTEVRISRNNECLIHNRFKFFDSSNSEFEELYTLSRKYSSVRYNGDNQFGNISDYDEYY